VLANANGQTSSVNTSIKGFHIVFTYSPKKRASVGVRSVVHLIGHSTGRLLDGAAPLIFLMLKGAVRATHSIPRLRHRAAILAACHLSLALR